MPVQIGAPTISGAGNATVAQSLDEWANERRQQRAQKNLNDAYEKGRNTPVEKDEEGNRIAPEQQKPFMGILGSKTVEQLNQGLRDAYIASIDRDNTEEINRIAQESDGDVDRYNSSVNEYRKKLLAGVDPSANGIISTSLDSMVGRGFTQVQRVSITRSNQASKDQRMEAMSTYLDEAARLTRNGEFKGAQENLLKSRGTLDSMVSSGDISSAAADELFLEGKKEVYRQGYKKEILDVAENDTEAAFNQLEELEKKIPNNFTPDEWENVISDIRTDVSRIATKVKAGAEKKDKITKAKLSDMKESLSAGFVVDSSEKAHLYNLVKGTELEPEFKRLLNVEAFAVLKHDDRAAVLNHAQDRATTLESQQEFIALKKSHDSINKMAEEDGYSLGVRQGLIDHIPFDPQDPQSFAKRIEQAEDLSGIYKKEVGPLTQSEVDGIVNILPESTATEKVELALMLGASPAIWKQLDKKNANVFAMAGAIGDRDVMSAIFRGQELIKTNQVKLPTQEEYLEVAEDVIGLAGEVYGIEDRKTVIEAAIAYHAATTDSPEVFSSGDFEDALQAVTGGTTKFNGYRIELPRGVSDDDFEDFAEKLHPDIIEELGGLLFMKPEDVRDAQWQSIGNGRYHVLQDGLIQLNKQGQPFVVEYSEEIALRNKMLNDRPKSVRELRR